MEAAPIVTLIAVGLAIVVIAAFLITVIYHLYQVYSRLNTILGVVGSVIEKTSVLDPIISEISADLATGHAAIEGAVERLKLRKGYSTEPERQPEPAGVGTTPPTASSQSSAAYRNY
ncbi:MAG TPA: hypothetical protein VG474_10180 [Solirubrobacteraceae bacterium]|nr:hypothetical protein [Solirubrobacteraceae bacterium]